MRKISGTVVWTKPMSLSRAAKLLSRFAAVDNGSSAAVSVYLQRASEAFNHLVQFHSKRIKMDHLEENIDSSRGGIPSVDSETGDKPRIVNNGDEVVQIGELEKEQWKEKKNKKRRNTEADSNRKKRRIEGAIVVKLSKRVPPLHMI